MCLLMFQLSRLIMCVLHKYHRQYCADDQEGYRKLLLSLRVQN